MAGTDFAVQQELKCPPTVWESTIVERMRLAGWAVRTLP